MHIKKTKRLTLYFKTTYRGGERSEPTLYLEDLSPVWHLFISKSLENERSEPSQGAPPPGCLHALVLFVRKGLCKTTIFEICYLIPLSIFSIINVCYFGHKVVLGCSSLSVAPFQNFFYYILEYAKNQHVKFEG